MAKLHLESNSSYERIFRLGKVRVTHFISVVTIIAILLNLVVYYPLFDQRLLATEIAILALVVVSYILLLTKKVQYQMHFQVLTWVIVLGLIGMHLFLYPYVPRLSDDLDFLFLRGLLCISILIPLTGVIGSSRSMFFQGIASIAYVLIYTMVHYSPYSNENSSVLLFMNIGYLAAVWFFVRNMQYFVNSNNAYKELLDQKNQEILENMSYAHRIQEALLPQESDLQTYFDDAMIWHEPKELVTSDFYWVTHENGHIQIALGGSEGSNLSGAMVTIMCRNIMNRIASVHLKPDDLLNKTRESVMERLEESEGAGDEKVYVSCIQISGQELIFAGARSKVIIVSESPDHNGPVVKRLKGEKHWLTSRSGDVNFSRQVLTVSKGSCVYLFTDGIEEQFDPDDWIHEYSEKFLSLLQDMHPEPLALQKEKLRSEFRSWKKDSKQVGDICVIGLRI